MRYWYRHSADFGEDGEPIQNDSISQLLFSDLIGSGIIEETEEVTKSAQKIQAIARGRKARKEKKEMDDAAAKVQAVARGRKARKEKKEMDAAAAKGASEPIITYGKKSSTSVA